MTREEARKKAENLVSQMTVEEAASQLRYDAPAIERLGIPEYNWWNESLHGVARNGTATMFPQAIGMAASFDTSLLKEVGQICATEGRAKYNENSKRGDRGIYRGLSFWSPNINIFRDPRWGRGQETYGEDPYLTSRLGVAYIQGLQGDEDGVPYKKAVACAKHFAGHSGPERQRHQFDAKISQKDLWETYLPAFEACVTEGRVEAVMGAYNRTNGEPCCAHTELMEHILRGEWKFEGHYVSDCWAIRDFHEEHQITAGPKESVKLALEKGCDLNCGCTYAHIMDAFEEGMIEEVDIRRSAVRLFTTRYLLGLFEKTPYDEIGYEVVECEAHLEAARRAAEESMVLLKNDGVLPLQKEAVKTIGVIGPNADNRRALCGNYQGTSSYNTTVLEGIRRTVGDDCRVLYSAGSHIASQKPQKNFVAEAEAVAELADVIVLCLGLNETLESEESSRHPDDKTDLSLPKSQQNLLERMSKTGKPLVVCVLAGSALDLSYADEHANAVLQAWYPGGEGGKVVAEALFGERAPSGKLPVTFYRDLNGFPDFTDYSMKGRTYRYYEKEPLYPFGYGLTYGSAELVSAEVLGACDYQSSAENGIELQADIKNSGECKVSEVVQIYVRVEGSENEVCRHRLCAFSRVELDVGETKRVKLKIEPKAFHTVDENGKRHADGTGAVLFAGFGQPDQRTASLTGKHAIALYLT